MRRSLVLAGGGAKIGWASGALQVIMDEARLGFDHIDATSGSVFNLGMLLSGRSATQVADAWANLSPREFVSFHPLREYLTFWRLPSLLTQQAVVERIMPKWGIDLEKIRACEEVNGHPVTVFETCAVGHLKRELDQIAEINRRVEAGSAAPGEHHATVHLVRPAERVPVDYLFFRTKRHMRATIEAGKTYARRYLAREGYLPGRAPSHDGTRHMRDGRVTR